MGNGLEDPQRGRVRKFRECTGEFVQILHDGDRHWLCISTFGCQPGEVEVIDTFYGGAVSNEIKMQICSIMKYEGPWLKLKFLPVQQQTRDSVDCGAFAIAWARKIAEDKAVDSRHTFDETLLRPHLTRALETNTLGDFPSKARGSVRRCKSRSVNIKLLCTCRMFWTREDEQLSNK